MSGEGSLERVVPQADEEIINLPGTWGNNYWEPDAADELNGGVELSELGGLLKAVVLAKRKRERAVSSMWWWVADLVNYGMERHGDAFYQLVEESDYVEESFNNAARIGNAFPRERRWPVEKVSFWAHGDVRTLRPDIADRLLARLASPVPLAVNQAEADDPMATPAEEIEPPIRHVGELRKEARAIRKAYGNEAEAAPDEGVGHLPDCPFCGGVGKVTQQARDGYFEVAEGREYGG